MKSNLDRGLVKFFEVEHCGFYRKENKKYKHVKGTMSESLSHVTTWLRGRKFEDTVPWDIEHNGNRAKLHCLNEYTDPETQDLVLVFWESYTDNSGYLKGIVPSGEFGSDSVGNSINIDTPSVDGRKPLLGRPLYYWFIPELDVMASISFPHSKASTQDVCQYIKKCIDNMVDIPDKKVKETTYRSEKLGREITQKIVEYPDPETGKSLRFYFNASMKEISCNQINYEELSSKITHIAVKELVSTKLDIPVKSGFEAYDLVRGKSHNNRLYKSVEIIEEVRVTEKELKDIVEAFFSEYDGHGETDIGFKTDEIRNTKWFSSYKRSELIYLNELSKSETYHNPISLMTELKKVRGNLIKELKTTKEIEQAS